MSDSKSNKSAAPASGRAAGYALDEQAVEARFQHILRSVAANISVMMCRRGLGVRELAEATEMPLRTMRKVLTAEYRGLTMRHVAYIATALDCECEVVLFTPKQESAEADQEASA